MKNGKKMTDCNLIMSYCKSSGMATTDFKRADEDYYFEDVADVLGMDGRYSNFIFNGDYRLSDNYQKNVSNCIILDFDDGFIREEFAKRSSFAYATGTTKSHNKDKNGFTCERFRVIIPTETAVDLDQVGFSRLMQEIFMEYPEADTSCKDTARAYSGYVGADVDIHYGEYFDWEPYYNKSVKREELRQWQNRQRLKPMDYEFTQDDTFKAMRSKFSKIYTAGNRNSAMADIILWCKKENIDYSTIENFVSELVLSSSDPLDDREMNQMFKYHLRTNR